MFLLLFSLKNENYKEKSKYLGAPELLDVLIEQSLYSNKYQILCINSLMKNNALSLICLLNVFPGCLTLLSAVRSPSAVLLLEMTAMQSRCIVRNHGIIVRFLGVKLLKECIVFQYRWIFPCSVRSFSLAVVGGTTSSVAECWY